MTYAGHKNKTMPDGQNIVDYIMSTIIQESRLYGGIPLPSREQIALVIRAMRTHPLLEYAAKYDFSELSKSDEVTGFWPTILSIDSFFRDAPLEVLDVHNNIIRNTMRLRNKKTGEVYYMYSESVNLGGKPQIILFPRGQVQTDKKIYSYDSLSKLNEDWEDYDE